MYSATPSFNDPILEGKSFINVYRVDISSNLYSVALISTLDNSTLAALIGHDITFDLI